MFVAPFGNADIEIFYVEEENENSLFTLFSRNGELTTAFQILSEYKLKLLQPTKYLDMIEQYIYNL